ncbi:hypothetical protein H072_8550 [Dactylellina haptotyla CBS 200.50]|uniref:non-specific serine/threonine protein kinase n=1 Tax=Dactylellina haptotyla (strain CBS 200.50) TaxID=1284197 RepID=S8BR72_DACHA|nr:hypothetical protein H072_8550 [Dactylellina haptotyla CBS 200.50]
MMITGSRQSAPNPVTGAHRPSSSAGPSSSKRPASSRLPPRPTTSTGPTGDELASNYIIEELVGRGAFGKVYKAWDKPNRRWVAIKVFDLENADDDIADLSEEIAILSECRHPNVTEHYISFFKGYHLWIVMEYVDYGSCSDWVRVTPLREEQYISVILREVVKALVYIHDCQLIHRDLKAANILLSTKGEVKLADFGVSARVTEYHAIRQTFVGTPLWMAPEVINTHLSEEAGYNSKIDIWSLGITAIELAVGEPPYAGTSHARSIVAIGAKPPPRLPTDFSDEFQDFVATCLVKDPRARPTSRQLLDHPFLKEVKGAPMIRQLTSRGTRTQRDAMGFPVKPAPHELSILADPPVASEDDDGWDFNSTIRSMQDIKFTVQPPTIPREQENKRRQSIASVVTSGDDGHTIRIEAPSRNSNSNQQTVRSHRRTTSNTELRVTGRKSLEPTRPTPSRPQTSHNTSSRPSLGLRDQQREREATVKPTTFGRQLASNEVNARVAGHRTGRASDGKRRVSIGEKCKADEPTTVDLPTARPQPAAVNSQNRMGRPSTAGQRRNTLDRQQSSLNELENNPFISGFKTAAPHDWKGYLGRTAFDSVVKLSLEELYLSLAPGKKKDIMKNMAKAWAELDAISPELELTLLRKIGLGLMRMQKLGLVVFGEHKDKDARCADCLSKLKDFLGESRPSTASTDEASSTSEKGDAYTDFKQEEVFARERRMAYLEKNDAEPLFATTRNEQIKNQHWNKANRSQQMLVSPVLGDVAEAAPHKGDVAHKISKESLQNAPRSTTPQVTPVKEVVFAEPVSEEANKRKERADKRRAEYKNKRAKEEARPSSRETPAARQQKEAAAEVPKRREVRRQQSKSSSHDGTISELEPEQEDAEGKPVAIDRTPATPKIERKRKLIAPINNRLPDDVVEAKAAPVRHTGPSPVKLYSPRTRLRQALESSPPIPMTAVRERSETKAPEGSRTPLMQKRISQLRSPEQNPENNLGKAATPDLGENRREPDQGKNRLAFARQVEYMDSPVQPSIPLNPPLLVRRESRISHANEVRPRAKSIVSNPTPEQLPIKTPGRKRSQSNIGSSDAVASHVVAALARQHRQSNASAQEVQGRSKPSNAPPPSRPTRTSPTDMFGPELVPAKRLERPILRPTSQPSGVRQSPARLGRPFTAHASAPALSNTPAVPKEQNRFSRSTTERPTNITQHMNDDDEKDSVYPIPPTRSVFFNL